MELPRCFDGSNLSELPELPVSDELGLSTSLPATADSGSDPLDDFALAELPSCCATDDLDVIGGRRDRWWLGESAPAADVTPSAALVMLAETRPGTSGCDLQGLPTPVPLDAPAVSSGSDECCSGRRLDLDGLSGCLRRGVGA